ncbi:hypothetical protein ACU01Y_003769 [Salmonella enterica subsp. enterica serovar Newport]
MIKLFRMTEERIKRLLIVSVITNLVLIFLFFQFLSGNIKPKRNVESVVSEDSVPVISPLCKLEKPGETYKSYHDYLDQLTPEKLNEDWNNIACYWVNPITKKYFKFDKDIRIMKNKYKDSDSGSDYFIYKFAYFNTPYISLLDLPGFIGAPMEEVKKKLISAYKIRLVTKGISIKRENFEEWIGSGFEVNDDGSDGIFGVYVLVKKGKGFWLIYCRYFPHKPYNNKKTQELIADLIETL